MASLNNHNNNYQRKRVANTNGGGGATHSSQFQQSQKGRKKGPAPQSYVFNDISNYEDQQIQNQHIEERKQHEMCDQEVIPNYDGGGYYDNREERNIIQQIEQMSSKGREQQMLSMEGINAIQSPDDTDFNSSCCDYQSDIFKEQPSEYIDDFSSNRFISAAGIHEQNVYPASQQSHYRQHQHFQSLQMGSVNQIFSLQDCASESDFKENMLLSGASAKTAYAVNQEHQNQRDRGIPKLPQQVQSQPSLRTNGKPNSEVGRNVNSERVASSATSSQGQNVPTQSQGSSQNHTTKNSCDQSLVTPSQKFNHNQHAQSSNSTTSKHSKQPLYSMVPNQISKNLNRQVFTPESNNQMNSGSNQNQKGRVYSYQESRGANSYAQRIEGVTPLSQNDSMDEAIKYGQSSAYRANSRTLNQGGDSYQNLTPQRNLPQPLSPQIKPSLSNMSRVGVQDNATSHSEHSVVPSIKPQGKVMSLNYQMQSNMQQQAQINSVESRNISAPYSNKTQNSGQKATVVYNEFKYYTTGADFQNTVNPQKYINISGLNQGNQLLSNGKQHSSSQNKRRSDISNNSVNHPPITMNGQGAPNSLQYELSPTNLQQCMFDMSSPKDSVSNGKQSFAQPSNTGTFVKANSKIRKQIFNTDRNHAAPKFTHNNASAAYQLHLKNDDYSPAKVIEAPFSSDDEEAQQKIKQLQQYIEQLESDLQDQQSKNADLKRRFKQRSFIQSFERVNSGSGVNGNASSKKHLSDTEDSLILSEKKGKKNSMQGQTSNLHAPRGSSAMRQNNSITNGNGYTFQAPTAQGQSHQEGGAGLQHSNSNCAMFGPNQQINSSKDQHASQQNQQQQFSLQNTNSRTNSHEAHPQQKSSSILDVKIRPIVNMKGMQAQRQGNLAPTNLSPQKLMRNNSALQFKNQDNQQDDSQVNQRRFTDQESSNILEYQVQDFQDQSSSQLQQSPLRNGQSQSHDAQDDDQLNNDQSNASMQELGNTNQQVSEDDCEGCERLKQLVFQAKEAIDDLKMEIDEWRDICSDKETELRQLQHKIYCDIVGVEKKTEFKEEVQTKEFDSEKPSSYVNGANGLDMRKIRNFIQHNKNRIRSRSKTHGSTLNSQSACQGSHSQVRSNSTNDQGQFSNKKSSSNCCGGGSSTSITLAGGAFEAGSSFRKKPALKNLKDLVREDQEFYEAQDVAIQTSFTKGHDNLDNQQMHSNVTEEELNSARANQNNVTPQKHVQRIKSLERVGDEKTQAALQQNQTMISAQFEEICSLRTQNQIQEQEIARMKQQMNIMNNQIEKFVTLISKTRKRNSKKQPGFQIDLDEIKQANDFISNIESYSILEKINEWKREEGLMDSQNEPVELHDPQPTRIPRPLKLIMDIDLNELDLVDPTTALQNAKKAGGMSQNGQIDNTYISGVSGINPGFNLNASSITNNYLSANTNYHTSGNSTAPYRTNHGASSSLAAQQLESNAHELLQMIKQEQENIKRVTDQKYKQFHRQQQEYLNNVHTK